MKREIIKADTGATFEVLVDTDGTVTMVRGIRTGTTYVGRGNNLRITGKLRYQPRGPFMHSLGKGRRCVLTIDAGDGRFTDVPGVALDPA